MLRRLPLTLGRLSYALATGVALLLVLRTPSHVAAAGAYTYQSGLAGALATGLLAGIDRVLARRVASGEAERVFPLSVLAGRLAMTGALAAVGCVALCLNVDPLLILALFLFVASQVIYYDFEGFWIAADLGDGLLGLSLGLNGLLTGVGIVVGASFNAPLMTLLSAAATVCSMVVLLASRRVKLRRVLLPDFLAEVRPVAVSVQLGVLYARSDLAVLALTGVTLRSVAAYGIVIRLFAGLTLVRGAIAQQITRDLAPMPPDEQTLRLEEISPRVQFASAGAGVGLLTVTFGIAAIKAFPALGGQLSLLAIAGVAVPMFMSHLPTTALVYANRRTHLLLYGTVAASIGSILLKSALVLVAGTRGAVASLGLVEYLSCTVFYLLYWAHPKSRASSVVPLAPLVATAGLAAISVPLFLYLA